MSHTNTRISTPTDQNLTATANQLSVCIDLIGECHALFEAGRFNEAVAMIRTTRVNIDLVSDLVRDAMSTAKEVQAFHVINTQTAHVIVGESRKTQ